MPSRSVIVRRLRGRSAGYNDPSAYARAYETTEKRLRALETAALGRSGFVRSPAQLNYIVGFYDRGGFTMEDGEHVAGDSYEGPPLDEAQIRRVAAISVARKRLRDLTREMRQGHLFPRGPRVAERDPFIVDIRETYEKNTRYLSKIEEDRARRKREYDERDRVRKNREQRQRDVREAMGRAYKLGILRSDQVHSEFFFQTYVRDDAAWMQLQTQIADHDRARATQWAKDREEREAEHRREKAALARRDPPAGYRVEKPDAHWVVVKPDGSVIGGRRSRTFENTKSAAIAWAIRDAMQSGRSPDPAPKSPKSGSAGARRASKRAP